ncbi:MAG: hypothetical protein BTN85_0120 [Candidatus Methanohalarchaeum thermophilum]|uniref:Uncharacterized protein n=1 Tax=Methanohalarchaeum thermophilum TaxID=1903181 RepID=A0A1Q6DTK3_METT1|nr:MAG: hypothetical protein BTN85_0120 [Candidatus Methanohalarchaeum thermophilum]
MAEEAQRNLYQAIIWLNKGFREVYVLMNKCEIILSW